MSKLGALSRALDLWTPRLFWLAIGYALGQSVLIVAMWIGGVR